MSTSPHYLLQKIRLHNFMLHQNTEMEFAGYPITLITGANGSGKTQILDGLLLGLGRHPHRLRHGNLLDLIGPLGSEATVELTLNNPLLKEQRTIVPAEEDWRALFTEPTVRIIAQLSQAEGLVYSIADGKASKRVLRRDVRAFFETLYIQGDNKLAFTEEGTVNVFAEQSSKNKFELLLEATGLASYRENLLATQESIDKSLAAIEPLRRKLALEREYLASLEKSFQLGKQRQEVEEHLHTLLVEELWALAVEAQKLCTDVQEKMAIKKAALVRQDEMVAQCQHQVETREQIVDRLDNEKTTLSVRQQEGQDRLRLLEGKNESNQRQYAELEEKKRALEVRRQEMARSEDNAKHLAALDRECARVEQQLAKSRALREAAGADFFLAQHEWERTLLADVLRFAQEAKQAELGLVGPLFAEIRLKKSAPRRAGEALRSLLGAHLFSFLAPSRQALLAAAALRKRLWPQTPPAFAVIEVSSVARGSSPWDRGQDAHATPGRSSDARAAGGSPGLTTSPVLADQIIASPLVKQALNNLWHLSLFAQSTPVEKILETVFSSGETSWHDEEIYWPWPAIGRGWVTQLIPASWNFSLENLRDLLEVEVTYQRLEEQWENLSAQRRDLLQVDSADFLTQRLAEIAGDLMALAQEIKQDAREVEQRETQWQKILTQKQEVSQTLESENRQLKEERKKLAEAEHEQTALQQILAIWSNDLAQKDAVWEEQRTKALAKGPCPEAIRAAEVINKERLRLEGKLETLTVSPIAEETVIEQREKVQRLEEELSGSTQYLAQLRQDMQKRLDDWHKEVEYRLQAISTAMGRMLSYLAEGVRLRLDKLGELEETGLHLEIRRSHRQWRDLGQLSGGEKVLTVQALIFALHLQTDSPLHAIDEYTQRLDLEFKARALEMAGRALEEASRKTRSVFAPQFLLLTPDTIGVSFEEQAQKLFKHIVIAPARVQRKKEKRARVQEI